MMKLFNVDIKKSPDGGTLFKCMPSGAIFYFSFLRDLPGAWNAPWPTFDDELREKMELRRAIEAFARTIERELTEHCREALGIDVSNI